MTSLETELRIVNLRKEQKKKRLKVPKLFFNYSQCAPSSAHTQISASELEIQINRFGQTDIYFSDAMC